MNETDVVFYECECPICGQKVRIGFFKGTHYSVARGGTIKCGSCRRNFIPNVDKDGEWIE